MSGRWVWERDGEGEEEKKEERQSTHIHTHRCVEITLNHGASQKALLTKLKVNKMFMSGTQSFIWFRIWLNNIYTRNRGALPETLSQLRSPESVVYSPVLAHKDGAINSNMCTSIFISISAEPHSQRSTNPMYGADPRSLPTWWFNFMNCEMRTSWQYLFERVCVCVCESLSAWCVVAELCGIRNYCILQSMELGFVCSSPACPALSILLSPIWLVIFPAIAALESNIACSALVIANWIR